jgi:hypothetical protein
MRTPHVVALSLVVFGIGIAAAQDTSLKTVEVSAEEGKHAITMACVNPEQPSLQDVQDVLNISDPAQAPNLRTKLMGAAAEACAAKEAKIMVMRSASGGLTWKPMKDKAM